MRISAIRWAPMASERVTVGSKPSGTTATVTPTANRNPSEAGVPSIKAIEKNAHSDRDRYGRNDA